MILAGEDRHDPGLARMIAAFEDGRTWGPLHLAMRDALVRYARERCPYYREAIPPSAAFEEVPLLTRDMVRTRLTDLLAEGVPEDRRVQKRTSGSSGQPLAFYRDSAQGPVEEGSAQRFLLRLHGVPADSTRIWISTHPEPFPPDLLARFPRATHALALVRHRFRRIDPLVHPVSTLSLTSRRLVRELRMWTSFRSWWMYGHASAIDRIAEEIESRDLPLPRPPALVITTGDDLTSLAERRISRVFDCPVHSWYGSHEMNGYVAGTLPGTRRYAVNPFLVHPEVTDEAGRTLPPGEEGLLVLTDLNNLVMPFVRYVTGDLARMAPDAPAGDFPVVDGLVGRATDAIQLADGRRLTAVTFGQALFGREGPAEAVRAYQCEEVRPGELEMRVVWAVPPDERLRSRVLQAFRRAAGPNVAMRLRDVDAVDRLPSGKAWIVRGLPRS
jgi:phenylacetate-CoA ligase